MISEVPKSNIPPDINVGDTLQGMGPNGPVIVKIIEIKEDTVLIDANHPLSGKKLIFDLEVVGVE
jgi:FKBP-type peptidyl-prolyl cis-trans isomerase 2